MPTTTVTLTSLSDRARWEAANVLSKAAFAPDIAAEVIRAVEKLRIRIDTTTPVLDQNGDACTVLAIDGQHAWVQDRNGSRYTVELSSLTPDWEQIETAADE